MSPAIGVRPGRALSRRRGLSLSEAIRRLAALRAERDALRAELSRLGAGVTRGGVAWAPPTPPPWRVPMPRPPGPLTPRELQVAALVAGGLRNEEIADALRLAEGTVRNYVMQACRRLGLRNRAELAVWYIRTQEGAARDG